MWWGLGVSHRRWEDKAGGGAMHPDVRHGIVPPPPGPGDATAGCGSHASAGCVRERRRSQECIIIWAERVLGRAEEQMAEAFNARRPPARGSGEHLQPVPFARGGLSP